MRYGIGLNAIPLTQLIEHGHLLGSSPVGFEVFVLQKISSKR